MLALVAAIATSLLCGRMAAAEELTRLYAGDDGGALYTRSDGAAFVAFAEHPGKNYAFVLRGTIKGDVIEVDWWDVPKGKRPRKGEATLKWSQNGARIVRTGGTPFGPDTFREIKPEQVPWPGIEAAGFQGQGAGDLNGAFDAQDNSRWYIRETAHNVVGVAEAGAQPGERARWVAVFFGKRTQQGAGSISGEWFDVAKGLDRKKGSFGAVLMTPADAIWGRELTVQLTGTKRGVKLEPDYAIDYSRMASVIESYMKQSDAVGWSYAIAGNGAVLRKGAGGSRRLKQDGGQRGFTVNTLAQAASVSKLVTAATLAKALKGTGHDFNDQVAPFLPKCWKRGPGVNGLTFGDIATHNSGFDDAATVKKVPEENLSKRVRMTFEMGQVKAPKPGDYQNYNYAVFRYLIPLVAKRQKALGIFEKFDCKDTALLNQQISVLFNELTFDMLRLGGLTPGKDASFLPMDGDYSLNYDWQDRKAKGSKPNEEGPYRGGAGYLALSAVGAGKFLVAFDAGEIVPMGWVRTMKHEKYGFDGGYGSKAGRAVWKNGGCPGGSCKSWAVVFPGNVQAYLVTNSGYFVHDGTRDPKAGLNLGEILVKAYNEAFR
jgi:hypothetical protein